MGDITIEIPSIENFAQNIIGATIEGYPVVHAKNNGNSLTLRVNGPVKMFRKIEQIKCLNLGPGNKELSTLNILQVKNVKCNSFYRILTA